MLRRQREVLLRPFVNSDVRKGLRMAKAKNRDADSRVPAEEKIARLLAVLVIKDVKTVNEKAAALRAGGFDIAETAELLGVSYDAARMARNAGKKRKKGS
jgi:hypothetical protein